MQAPIPAALDARLRLSRTLRLRLVERARRHGPMPFVEFMASALYDPTHGYYTAHPDPWGAARDFITVPQVHPALGQAIARLVAEVDASLERPAELSVVEMGSGDGTLVSTVASTLDRQHPDVAARLRIWSVERGGAARERQRALPEHVQVVDALDGLPTDLCGLFYSNELLDAFPVHRLTLRDGVLLEAHVDADVDADRLVERWLPAVDAEAARRQLDEGGTRLREGQIAEVCVAVGPWVAGVAKRLRRGALVTIDYGHETATLYNENRPDGTLVCQSRFRLGDDFLSRPGAQDLTTQVDFGNLRRHALARDFAGGDLCSLRVFLLGMGVLDVADEATESGKIALRHLLVDPVADSHRVMLLTRGLSPDALRFGRGRLEPDASPGDPC